MEEYVKRCLGNSWYPRENLLSGWEKDIAQGNALSAYVQQ